MRVLESLKRLIPVLLILCALSTLSFGQNLDPAELRETATNLLELKAARERLRAIEEFADQSKALSERERAAAQRELDAERRLREIAERERDVERQRGDALEAIMKAQKKGPGFGCRIKRVLTVGLGRCA